MKRRTTNLNNYIALDMEATEEQIRDVIGDDLLIYNRKKYIPKNICPIKLFRLHTQYGEADWPNAGTTEYRED